MMPRASDLFLDQQQQPWASTALISSLVSSGITKSLLALTQEPELSQPFAPCPIKTRPLLSFSCVEASSASARLRIPSNPPASSARVQVRDRLGRKGPSPRRPLSTPLCIEAEERGECVLLTGYLTPMRASSISIPMHPRHCRHHLKSCTSRHIATHKSGERIRTTEETKRTAPVMQSGQKARPRLPGRLFNFHIPSPVRSVAATPAGIERPPKAKDNMQPL